jgi:hypothetical protein
MTYLRRREWQNNKAQVNAEENLMFSEDYDVG